MAKSTNLLFGRGGQAGSFGCSVWTLWPVLGCRSLGRLRLSTSKFLLGTIATLFGVLRRSLPYALASAIFGGRNWAFSFNRVANSADRRNGVDPSGPPLYGVSEACAFDTAAAQLRVVNG